MFQQNPQKNYQNDRTGAFGKLGLEEIGQGKRLRTSKTDSIFGKGKSFVNKILRAKSGRAKMQFKNLSEKNIGQIDKLISEKLGKHVSRGTAHLNRKEARDIKMKGRRMMYDDKTDFSKEDFKDLKRAVKAIRAGGESAKHAVHILHTTSGISSDNSRVNNNMKGDFKSSNFQNIAIGGVASPKTDQFKNKQNKPNFQFGYKFGNNEDGAKKEENKKVNINPQPDKKVKELENKAKDLPI